MTEDKKCSRCGCNGPFGKDSSAKDGLRYQCKKCQSEMQSYHRRKNKPFVDKTKCYKCGSTGPFAKSIRRLGTLFPRCKKCWLSERVEKRKKYKAQTSKYNREYNKRNAKRLRVLKLNYQRQYRIENLERVRLSSKEYSRRRRESDREGYRKSARDWFHKTYKKDPHRFRGYRAKRKGARGHASAAQIRARVAFFGNCCAYCGGEYQAIDHVIAIVKGGTNWPANQRPACRACNSRKSSSTWKACRI